MLCKATQKSFHRIYSSRPGVCQIPHLTCPRSLRAYVLTRKRALRAFCAKVPTCVRAINTNNKNKFSVICFPYIFVIVLSFFFLWNKTCTFLHCSYLAEAFNRCYYRLCAIKWFYFCLRITLRVIFKWLIKGGRWIIMRGSKWIYKELFKYLAMLCFV